MLIVKVHELARTIEVGVKVVQQPRLGGLLLILVERVPAAAAFELSASERDMSNCDSWKSTEHANV